MLYSHLIVASIVILTSYGACKIWKSHVSYSFWLWFIIFTSILGISDRISLGSCSFLFTPLAITFETLSAIVMLYYVWRKHLQINNFDWSISKKRTIRKYTYYLWISLIFISIFYLFSSYLIGKMAKDKEIFTTQNTLESISNNLNSILTSSKSLCIAVSQSPTLVNSVKTNDITQINSVIDRYGKIEENSIMYILDTKGTTIASTNRSEPDSFVNKNYATRDYFKSAISGTTGRLFAIGLTSKFPGYYNSAPIIDSSGKILGVCVIKNTLNKIFNGIATSDKYYLIDENSIIFASTEKNATASLWSVDKNITDNLVKNKIIPQFIDSPVFPKQISVNVLFSDKGQRNLLMKNPTAIPNIFIIGSIKFPFEAPIFYSIYIIMFSLFLISLIIFDYQIKVLDALEIAQDEHKIAKNYFSIAGVMLLVLAEDMTVKLINKKGSKLLGYDESEIIGKNWFDFFVPTDLCAESKEVFEKLIKSATLTNESFEDYVICKDGQKRLISWNTTLLPSLSGSNISTLSSGEDITEKRVYELGLKRSKEIAESENNIKSEFLSNMSHEIRTPLNGIMGMTQLALIDEPEDNIKEYLLHIMSASNSLLVIINDILDYSKLEAKKINISNKPFSVSNTLTELVSLLSVDCNQKNISLETYLCNDIPQVLYGDEVRIKQILLNLMGNAIKFTEHGTVKITVNIEQNTDEYVDLRFDVSDTGIGIPADKLDRLFQRFSQIDSSTTKKFQGTGLGLAITQKLLTLMNGKIKVISKENEGSTFSFNLPLNKSSQTVILSPKTTNDINTEIMVSSDLKNIKVLIAEDDNLSKEILSKIIQELNFSFFTAANGLEAVELCMVNKFDIILMDIQMPELDGIKATHIIRTFEGYTDVPIIAITSNAIAGDKEECLAAGMTDYVTKPINLSMVKQHILKALHPN